MGMVNLYGKMDQAMKENSIIISSKGKGEWFFLMEKSIKVIGKIIKCMEMG